jgi:hypothetical protein
MKAHFVRRQAVGWTLLLSLGVFSEVPRELTVRKEVPVAGETAQDFTLPIASDAGGNIYARYGDGQHAPEPLVKISPTGKRINTFDLASAASLGPVHIVDLCTNDRGELLVLAKTAAGAFNVVAFGLDGTVRSTIRVDAGLEPFQFAVAKTGYLVVGGRALQSADLVGGADSEPFIVMLGPDGHLIGNVQLSGDVAPVDKGERIQNNGAVKNDKLFENSLVMSRMETGDDGNVYLMRHGKSGVVFVISPTGVQLRRLKLQIPPGSSLREMKVAKQRIAALFVRKLAEPNTEITSTFVRLYDAETGNLIADYVLRQDIPNMLTQFDGGTNFTFFGADQNGNLKIFHVVPK